ncbi:DDB1- and CUL4-associated factor 12 [Podochytrium sp. JEL0797]|nr:DDB1- and CUL4-associated factor 12 [Podochytrium sp. JEL0797]
MVFTLEFASNDTLVSGGRDGNLCFWNLADASTISHYLPTLQGHHPVAVHSPVSGYFSPLTNTVLKPLLTHKKSLVDKLNPTSLLSKLFPTLHGTNTTTSGSPLFSHTNSPTNPFPPHPILQPPPSFGTIHSPKTRIRALTLVSPSTLATLSTTGTLKLFDIASSHAGGGGIHALPASTLSLTHSQETVCMAYHKQQGVLAVGSMCHVTLVDPRCNLEVMRVKSVDDGWGVRSLAVDAGGVVAVGGGVGRVSFLDVRVGKYLEWEDGEGDGGGDSVVARYGGGNSRGSSEGGRRERWLSVYGSASSTGPFPQDESDSDDSERASYPFQQQQQRPARPQLHLDSGNEPRHLMRDAIYTLSYCPYGVRLFAGGGPLQLSLTGSYAGIWG